ncbi:helix-turn-helix domain-containing protein [Microtetraspora malaysiensis]|uniref:helix-turn-helix domain-containing protein n=1 Tax=Microtetraspora malaysiensis TaxID=161358 RepID=UPI000835B3F7|nr:helix-turn-helix transcriptional regulator [Microtetraspora malaysiensis]
MANERLRAALLELGVSIADLATAIEVDPKTAQRWITKGRAPYRKHRYAVATHLGMDESYLWPEALTREQVASASESEIVTVYPHRWAVPRDAWGRLFAQAQSEIGVLVYSGLFLADDAGIVQMFGEKAGAGVRVRILLGDPDSPKVAQRGADEGIDGGMAARIRNALVLYRLLRGLAGVEIRLHRTVLYNSIYRGDDQLLVNIHAYGTPAAQAPVIHLRATEDEGAAAVYLTSLERVWATAEPAKSSERIRP